MTVWESLGLISVWQWAYALGLAALFLWRGPSLVAWVLLADFLALMAIAGAKDFALMSPDEAHWSMLVVWIATAAYLAPYPGAARIIATGSAVVAGVFIACLVWGVQFSTTSAIVNAAAFIMLGVACFGMGGNSGGGRRVDTYPVSLAISGGNSGMVAGGLARGADLLSQERGGR